MLPGRLLATLLLIWPAASADASEPATAPASTLQSRETPPAASQPSYEVSFRELHRHLGQRYPGFRLKDIDWAQVGVELLPVATAAPDDRAFGLACLRLVAALQDAHAQLLPGTAQVPEPPLPGWGPGLACLMDDRNRPVVYFVEPGSPAAHAGAKPGLTITTVDGRPAADAMADCAALLSTYLGYSSERHLQYDAARMFLRRPHRGAAIQLTAQDASGATHQWNLQATRPPRYIPRLPVPIDGIDDAGDVGFKRFDDEIGYLYVRRIRADLPEDLDRAIAAMSGTKGLIVDVRGNSGGGFDGLRALRNFNLDDGTEPLRPRYTGPIALLIDSRCISAGEGWASWFVATRRARLFGSATAGASSRKETYTLTNDLYRVIFPVKLYRGFLNRPIERRGLEPDVPIRNSAADLAAGRDSVLEAARRYLAAASQPAEP